MAVENSDANGHEDVVAVQEAVAPAINPDDPKQILLATILRHADAGKWDGSPFEAIKRVSNTKVGGIGQDFLEDFATLSGISTKFPVNAKNQRAKQSSWDIELDGIKFELKTATEDTTGKFQFNHIRYHRSYDAVVCIGISPTEIFFGMWTKADIVTGKAGALVSMEKGANASYKLTKSPKQLAPIADFPDAFTRFAESWAVATKSE